MLFRLILLLTIAAVVVLFTLQNLTPTLALTFLGIKTPALPFSWWVLGALAACALTTMAISFLFSLSHFVARQFLRSQFKRAMRRAAENPPAPATPRADSARAAEDAAKTYRQDDSAWQDWSGYETSTPHASSTATSTSTAAAPDSLDDWEAPASEDWEETPRDRTPAFCPETPPTQRPRTEFEKPQEPRRRDRSGSTYSYSYRDSEPPPRPKEPVVDADYRVIVPPYRPLDDGPPMAEENADDWFEEDNDASWEREGRDRPQR
ncbi:hypothetical protein [Leptodesmis sp.]|uniref:hypothetical protein n=1 Tax=Leptodesmis sp. TaxID=3100501 RepID=UPI00405347E0